MSPKTSDQHLSANPILLDLSPSSTTMIKLTSRAPPYSGRSSMRAETDTDTYRSFSYCEGRGIIAGAYCTQLAGAGAFIILVCFFSAELLSISSGARLSWEILQLPLYTPREAGTLRQKVFAVAHCTIGDVMISGLSLLLALAIAARPEWPLLSTRRVWVLTVFMGMGYTE